jgi:hypothetical protein
VRRGELRRRHVQGAAGDPGTGTPKHGLRVRLRSRLGTDRSRPAVHSLLHPHL